MNPDEIAVLTHLLEAWEALRDLPDADPTDRSDFARCMREATGVVAGIAAHREKPGLFSLFSFRTLFS